MADRTRQGEDWNPFELDAIIADYFAMLGEELARRPYVKAHHRAILMQQTGRSAASIEFKHRNISAVLQELGLPWIWGYKPALNYQDALFDAVDRYLSGHREAVEQQSTLVAPTVAFPDDVFTAMPVSARRPRRASLERLVRKFDPVERDFRNRQLGRAGEEFVVDIERRRLIAQDRTDLAGKVRWVAMEDGDGAGFDILSFDPAGKERLIEVKTTNGAAQTPFFMTHNEMAVAAERPEHWHLYRVHLFSQQPKIFTARPPLEQVLRLDPETWRAAPANLPT
ncbi:MAG: DUF3883 domain-containing protein [Devosia sp.]|uniref:DUF3883 domain-containing protein n=1 Tax=Devosia sp. TaxID=1871048 RepID=UPI0019E229CE|nr:DUF3883 domain-containing protein [Devosia sp.]MBF0677319.1 DUF3883 domain-containing protein [Devosia sp.]